MNKASNNDIKKKWLRIEEVSNILAVSKDTLRIWDREGKLKAVIINARGDRRYRVEDIEKFVADIEAQQGGNNESNSNM